MKNNLTGWLIISITILFLIGLVLINVVIFSPNKDIDQTITAEVIYDPIINPGDFTHILTNPYFKRPHNIKFDYLFI